MKIIFLDIDGVLNSDMYNASLAENDNDDFNYIDLSRIKLIKNLVEVTSAKIVLISSLRVDWDKSSDLCGKNGNYINKCFAEYGLSIMDKTPYISFFTERRKEISLWLSEHRNEVESFVIIDDADFGWEKLSSRVVNTNPRGYGLEEEHINKSAKLLAVPVKFK